MTIPFNKRTRGSVTLTRTKCEELINKHILSHRETYFDLDNAAREINQHNPSLQKVTVYNVLTLPIEDNLLIMSKMTRQKLKSHKEQYQEVLQQVFGTR